MYIIYLIMSFIWAIYSVYMQKNDSRYSENSNIFMLIIVFIINFISFPIALGVAIYRKRLFKSSIKELP